ncbi:MAG: alpha/beta hydrolase [Acidimicrobiia bacterium]|nr:alpha/beta hydrolase [Acidimicrobiia bacterium]
MDDKNRINYQWRIVFGVLLVFLGIFYYCPDDKTKEHPNQPFLAEPSPEWKACFGSSKCRRFSAIELGVHIRGDWHLDVVVAGPSSNSSLSNLLFVDPGGPGSDGVLVATQLIAQMGSSLSDSLSIVGWKWSSPRFDSLVSHCQDAIDSHFRSLLSTNNHSTTWECFGSTLEFPSMIQRAVALDALREILGKRSIIYLAYSYGSTTVFSHLAINLSAVDAIVLDAPIDPFATPEVRFRDQIDGFDDAWTLFLDACRVQVSCPIDGDQDFSIDNIFEPRSKFERTITGLGSGDIGQSALALAIISQLYSGETSYPRVSQLLLDAYQNDFGSVANDFWKFVGRLASGVYNGRIVLMWGLQCADQGSTEVATRAFPERSAIARTVANFLPDCLPQMVVEDGSAIAELEQSLKAFDKLPSLLIAGSRQDPVISISQWKGLLTRFNFDQSDLILVDGSHHTSYPGRSARLDANVERFLLDASDSMTDTD